MTMNKNDTTGLASIEDMNDMMSVADTAEFFGCNVEYVREHLCKIKGFPVIRIGRRYFIHKDGLEKWLKSNYGSVFFHKKSY